MSTRSVIGKLNKDGSVKTIYCHHDGYPEGVGAMLANYYENNAKVDKLLELGDMSSLGKEPVSDPELWNPMTPYNDNFCCTYKGRGEENVDAKTFNSVKEAKEHYDGCDYMYLIDENDVWFVYDLYSGNSADLLLVLSGDADL